MTIEDRYAITQLLAEYGALLTDKQRDTLTMYCDMDLSLAEVAAEYGTTRQAVRDVIVRAVAILEQYEAKLGNVRRRAQLLGILTTCTDADWRQGVANAIALLED